MSNEFIKSTLQKLSLLQYLRVVRKQVNCLNLRLVIQNLGYRIAGTADNTPIPPARLLELVIMPPEIAWYLRSGQMAYDAIQRSLLSNSIAPHEFKEILEFGCGTGRILWYWRKHPRARLHGTDFNLKLVKYCQSTISDFASCQLNDLAPPLAYPEGKFDLIYANSVFTHLPENLQITWMREMRRILQTNGYLYITVHGSGWRCKLRPDRQKRYDNGILVVIGEEHAGSNQCNAYHSQKYVSEEFSKGFSLVDYIPNGARHADQDIYLFRKAVDVC